MEIYKKKPLNFREAVDSRQLRLHRKSLHQREARDIQVNQRRGLAAETEEIISTARPATSTNPAARAALSRRDQLAKYKEEKLLRKKLEAERKKPAFKLCKIKYDYPVFLHSDADPSQPPKVGVVTRSMAKAASTVSSVQKTQVSKIPRRILEAKGKAAKGNVAGAPEIPRGEIPVAVAVEPITVAQQQQQNLVEPTVQSRKSFAPDNFQFTAPKHLTSYVLNQASTFNNNDKNESAVVEPISVGSDHVEEAHSSTKAEPSCDSKEIEMPSVSEPQSSKANTDNPDTDVKTVGYFRNLVETNTQILSDLRSKWLDISEMNKEQISENVNGQILAVTGQTSLLLNKKFKQFIGLIDECEQKSGEHQTNVDDLQGFWEMMYIQVEDLLAKYNKLGKTMDNDWLEAVSPVKIAKRCYRAMKNVRVNKAQEARQRLAKTKAALVQSEIFSPLRVNNSQGDSRLGETKPSISNENVCMPNPEANQPLVRIHERMSFFQQLSTRENIGVDKVSLANLFSPLKVESDRQSSISKGGWNDQLIRFSDIHCLVNKENIDE